MTIVVIRHGETVADIIKVCEGRANFDLTDKGIMQVTQTAKHLQSLFQFQKIYASPLLRTVHSAQIIQAYIPCEIVYLDNLMEFNNGKIAGLPFAEANTKYPKDPYLPYDKAMYGMESMKEFRKRADNALDTILKEDLDTVAIVAHGGIINQLYQAFLQLEEPAITKYITGDAGYHIWTINDGIRKVLDDIQE